MGVRHALLASILFLVCTGIATAALIDSTADGPFSSGGSNEQDYYALVTSMWTYTDSWGNATVITIPCDFGTCAWNGKSGSSNNNSDYNGANSKTKVRYSNATNFMVTDEFSQVALVTSMGDNGTRMQYVLNTVRAINGTNNGAGRGSLPLWCESIDNYVLNLTCTTDTASDGDARIIDALFTCSGNTNFNSSLRDDCYTQAKLMAADFHAKDMLGATKAYEGDSSQNITRWVCGGANVCSAITNSGFMYSGYYGDDALAMLKACKRTGNVTYCGDSVNMSMQAIQAAGNASVGYWDNNCRVPQGVHHQFDASVPVHGVCTNTCTSTGGYWDYDDAPRYTNLGQYLYQYNRTVASIGASSPLANMSTNLLAMSGIGSIVSSTSFAPQISPDCRGSSKNGGFYESTYGAQLFFWTNQSLVNGILQTAMGNAHFIPATGKWDSGDYGVYRATRPVRALGNAIGLDENAYTLYNNSGPSVNSATILPTTAYANDTLSGYCNATSPSALPMNYTVAWFRNGAINGSLANSSPAVCYQETANVTTSCGGLGNGTYGIAPSDDDPGSQGYMYVNYTKPANATSASIWQVRYGLEATKNLTINSSCWNNGNTLVLGFFSATGGFGENRGRSNPVCYNGTGWMNMSNQSIAAVINSSLLGDGPNDRMWDGDYTTGNAFTTGGFHEVFYPPSLSRARDFAAVWEEGMFWSMNTSTQGVSTLLANVSGLQRGQNWTFACMATDANGASAFSNSTTLTISDFAPVNNWSRNNQSFNHNQSTIFGNYCTDQDAGDTIAYSTNSTVFPILTNGSINYTANVSTSGNYTVNVSCSDGTLNTTATVRINVTNNPPLVNTTGLTPLPGQAGSNLSITYTCTDPDNDVCNVSVFYAWYKNGVLNSTITGVTLGSGNFTTGDNITGSVRVSDGNLNSSWMNTSTATIGDTTPPVATNFSVSPQAVTTSTTTTISVNCTDNNQIGVAYAEVTDIGGARTNFTMSLQSGNVYAYSYQPPNAGTYSARAFCVDGNGNSVNTTSTAFTASPPTPGGSNGGGGGADNNLCSFVLLQPVTRVASNPLCPTGGTSQDLTISVQNNLLTATDFTLDIPEQRCTSVPSKLSLGGGQKGQLTLTNCSCPTVDGQEDDLNVTVVQASSACSQQFTLQLTSSQFGNVIQNPAFLLMGVGIIGALAVLFIVVVGAIAKRI